MSDIKQIRELHLYKKMYHELLTAVEQATKICDNETINKMLFNSVEKTCDIYFDEKKLSPTKISPNELAIIYLLEFIRDREIFQSSEIQDLQISTESTDWILSLRHIDATLSEDEINRRIHGIFQEYLE